MADPTAPGEYVLWSGRPDERRWFDVSDWVSGAGLLLLSAFYLFWQHGVATARTTSGGQRYPLAFQLWGWVIFALAWILTIGFFFLRHQRKPRTTYTLTTSIARVDIGKRSYTASATGRRQIWWTADRRHVTVVWGAKPGVVFLGRFTPLRPSKRLVYFAEVTDGAALVAAIDRLR